MSLSDLLDSVYTIGFGKLCRATALGVLVSCSGGQEENSKKIKVAEESSQHSQGQVDSFPPYVNLNIVGNQPFGSNLSIYIMVDDIFPILKDSTVSVAPGLAMRPVREKSNALDRYSSNLDRIELYENGKLVNTIHPDSTSTEYISFDVQHRNGNFEYKTVVYDNAGNKTESVPLAITLHDGMYFRQDVLAKDKAGPEIKKLKLIGDYISAWIEDKSSCVREVRLYDQNQYIPVNTQLHDAPLTYFSFQWEGLLSGHKYQLEAQDHAGNVTSSEVISILAKKL